MAKKFLEKLGDSYEDDALLDIIPASRGPKQGTSRRGNSPRRKSKLRNSIGEALEELPSGKKEKAPSTKQKRKSFLEAMEEAFEDNAFDDIIPKNRRPQKTDRLTKEEIKVIETRFSTTITTDILELARKIAIAKNIRVKDVINTALKKYVEEEVKRINV